MIVRSDSVVKLTWGGDAMCLGPELAKIRASKGRYNFNTYLEGGASLLQGADYALVNLETPICPSKPLTEKAICFNTPIEFLWTLKKVGVDFVSTANNHCLDQGISGVDETISSLNAVGLDHTGTYASREDSARIFIKEIIGIRFAIVCSTFGTNSQHNGILLNADNEWKVDLLKKTGEIAEISL